MTTNKHTPGPWNYSLNESHSGHEVWTLGENKADIIYVADVQAKANARLIARAPNLLAALETITECLEEAHQEELDNDHYGDGPDGCSYCDAIAAARLVIAKARGEVQP